MDFQAISIVQLNKITLALRKKFLANGKQLEKPTYTVVLPDGSKQVYEHDAMSAEQSGALAQWQQYERDTQELNMAVQEKTFEYAFYKGIQGIEDLVIPESWLQEQAWLGIEYENTFALKSAYIQTEFFKTPQALMDGFMQIMQLSAKGVDKETVDAAEAAFRRAIPGEQNGVHPS